MQEIILNIFFGTWLFLFFFGIIVALRGSPALKVKVQRYMPGTVGLLFLFFVTLLEGPGILVYATPAVALIIYLNMVAVKICTRCGTTNRSPYMFPVPRYCHSCGVHLSPERANPQPH